MTELESTLTTERKKKWDEDFNKIKNKQHNRSRNIIEEIMT